LATIRIVKPDKAAGIEMRILQMAQKGQLRQQVSEQQLIGMMEQLSEAAAKNNKITFQRRKVAGWSDSEDDDDDSDLL
jgi:programmed cell death protein 5|tara:strand:+ start:299 stop:532 length:234 start_codon:yes stop_codon:yes gene_type:complete